MNIDKVKYYIVEILISIIQLFKGINPFNPTTGWKSYSDWRRDEYLKMF